MDLWTKCQGILRQRIEVDLITQLIFFFPFSNPISLISSFNYFGFVDLLCFLSPLNFYYSNETLNFCVLSVCVCVVWYNAYCDLFKTNKSN